MSTYIVTEVRFSRDSIRYFLICSSRIWSSSGTVFLVYLRPRGGILSNLSIDGGAARTPSGVTSAQGGGDCARRDGLGILGTLLGFNVRGDLFNDDASTSGTAAVSAVDWIGVMAASSRSPFDSRGSESVFAKTTETPSDWSKVDFQKQMVRYLHSHCCGHGRRRRRGISF